MSRNRSAVLLAVAVLAGCGGKEGTPPTPAPAAAASPTAQARAIPMAAPSSSVSLDPCRLLTGQEIAAALHTAVGDGVAQKRPQSVSCRWAAASGLESATVSVTVYGDAKEARAAFDEAVEANGYRPLRGLGQGAYSSPMYDLTVLSGRYELAVDVNVMSEDQAPVARSLAQQAVPRLPR
jgi:uncharacterized protein DUF3558